jgi:hypothetical protein
MSVLPDRGIPLQDDGLEKYDEIQRWRRTQAESTDARPLLIWLDRVCMYALSPATHAHAEPPCRLTKMLL